jgi:hypothetical protein
MQKVKNTLEIAFGEKVRVEGNTAKVHLKELDGVGIYQLNAFNLERFSQVKDLKVKRSGMGLTVIVTVED